MRGDEADQGPMFSYISVAQRVPQEHPMRGIRAMADIALKELSPEFDRLYSKVGRPSIPPERLLRALLLQYFYGIRSERLLMEQLNYNLLFRWFVGLSMDDEVWDASSFSKNRDRLLDGDIAQRFLNAVLAQAREKGLTSDEHFSIDGTLIQAWAGQKSFRPKDGSDDESRPKGRNPEVDFKGKKRKNDTHQSTTDPDARQYCKGSGQESKLSYLGHVVMENRHGLVVGCQVTHADGHGERDAGRDLMSRIHRKMKVTLGADKGYDTADFVADMRSQDVTPHVAQNNSRRRSAIDERTTRHPGYRLSQIIRKTVEHPFGWLKAAAGLRQIKVRGRDRVDWVFTFAVAAFNLIRMQNLCSEAT
jgi:transposase